MSKADIVRGLLQQAITIAGSQAKLAAACVRVVRGKTKPYSQNSIHRALKDGYVSPILAQCIERATGGAVSADELSPQIHEYNEWLLSQHIGSVNT